MPSRAETIPLEDYLAPHGEESRRLFEALRARIESVGPSEMRVTKSQIAFRRDVGFAWAWIPAQYLRGKVAPLVLTVDLSRRDPSPRWKQVVEPRPGRFTHHMELYDASQMDDEVVRWLREAWEEAARP